MDKEKKEYIEPHMEVLELNQVSVLLSDSGEDYYDGEGG